MSEEETILTEVTFDLPVGYEDKAGAIHKSITMRRMKNRDIIKIQKDHRVKAINASNANTGAVDIRNPITSMMVGANLIELFSVLFTQIITAVGTVPKENITMDLFLDMWQADMMFLIKKYGELNKGDDAGEVEFPGIL